MKLYKLTNQDCTTKNNTLWGENITHKTNGEGNLCSSGWLHAYQSPELALFMNPIHGNFPSPILWEAEGEGDFKDDNGLKCGVTQLTTVKKLDIVVPTTEQCIKFALLCAKEVYKDDKFLQWCENWLNGTDRSEAAAEAEAWVAAEAAEAAAEAAAWAAEAAAWAAARAAGAAAWVAAEAAAEAEAWVAAEAAEAAAWAAEAAAEAAAWAAEAADKIDLIEIAKISMKY
jgi:hypothetical protein